MIRRWLLITTLLAACGDGNDAKPAAPAAKVENPVPEGQLTSVKLSADAARRLGIETTTIGRADSAVFRTVGGEVIAPPGKSIVVVAPTAGTVLPPIGGELPAAGARVGRGQPLLRVLALPPDQANVRQTVAVAEARLRQVEAEAKRVADLYQDRLVSARENEAAQADLTAARAAAAAARSQQALVERGDLGDIEGLTALRLSAPSAGVVGAVHVGRGQAVAAGTALLELVSVDQLWVRVGLYAGDAREVAPDRPAAVRVLGAPADSAIEATPVRGPPSADPAAASVDRYYQVSGANLRPGERVTVDLPLLARRGPGPNVSVPLSALVYDAQGGTWLYQRVDSVTFVRRRVDIARVDGGRAILARGPAAGTVVVTAGVAELFGTEFGAGK